MITVSDIIFVIIVFSVFLVLNMIFSLDELICFLKNKKWID
jgi:hypothetical protein